MYMPALWMHAKMTMAGGLDILFCFCRTMVSWYFCGQNFGGLRKESAAAK